MNLSISLSPDQLTVIKILLMEEQLHGDESRPTPMRPLGGLHDEVVDILETLKSQTGEI